MGPGEGYCTLKISQKTFANEFLLKNFGVTSEQSVPLRVSIK